MGLRELIDRWDAWTGTPEAEAARRDHDGWEGDFPGYAGLVEAAIQVIDEGDPSDQELELVARCMEISEEDELVADELRERLPRATKVTSRLARSSSSTVRWQCYDVLGDLEGDADPALMVGLRDPDAYARRRAFLAVFGQAGRITEELMARFLADADDDNRAIAADVARHAGFLGLPSLAQHSDSQAATSPRTGEDAVDAGRQEA